MTASANTVHSVGMSKAVVAPPVSITTQNRRSSLRISRFVDAQLTCMGSAVAIDCRVVDISEDGAYVSAISPANLSVGQRYHIELAEESDAPDLASALCQGCYATIVRTDRRPSQEGSTIGAGLRFDRPIYL